MAGDQIAPIGVPESNAWWPRLRSVFERKHTDTLAEVRGEGTGLDMSTAMTAGRRYAEQRNSAAAGMYVQGHRGQQAAIPTPQQLIRQVTGVGDPPQGR
jgi:hypothetical protein